MKLPLLFVKIAKHSMESGDKKGQKHELPYEGKSVCDIPYLEKGSAAQKFDIYYADPSNNKGITIVDIHGGAYVKGTRKSNLAFAKFFLSRGYNFISCDYRLLGKDGAKDAHDQVRDLCSNLSYIWQHAEELRLDKDKLVLTGDSCGGQYALLLAEFAINPAAGKENGFDVGGFSPKAILLNCPVFDYVHMAGRETLTKASNKYLFGPKWNEDAYLEKVSPMTYFQGFNLPLFVSTCRNDFLREESFKLKKVSEEQGFPLTFVDIDSHKKKVAHVHNVIAISLPESKQVNDAMDEFISANLTQY